MLLFQFLGANLCLKPADALRSMMSRQMLSGLVFVAAFSVIAMPTHHAEPVEEGMWLFSPVVMKVLKERHQFEPGPDWSDSLMRSCLRFSHGGAASFVSSDGLVLTSHHVVQKALEKLSASERNILSQGFLAAGKDDELKADGLILDQLVSIQNVTDMVKSPNHSGVEKSGIAGAGQQEATGGAPENEYVQSEINSIKEKCRSETGDHCEVVSLYGGQEYHLYRYRRFNDVRLVWAPESAAAYFGGDIDNYSYPRYCLDACLLRVYENNRPVQVAHFLKWSDSVQVQEKELVFATGSPGKTKRHYTVAALKYERDVRLPDLIGFLRRREDLLQQYCNISPKHRRQASDELIRFQNARKVSGATLSTLQDPGCMSLRIDSEKRLRERMRTKPAMKKYLAVLQDLERIQGRKKDLRQKMFTLNTQSYFLAKSLARLAIERRKPNAERLPEYRDENLEALKIKLLANRPMYPELERAKLADLISRTVEILQADDPICDKLLNGKGPNERAAELIAGTKIFDRDYLQKFLDSDGAGVMSCRDSLIHLALDIYSEEYELTKQRVDLERMEWRAYQLIDKAVYELDGSDVSPNGTSTPRLSFGTVKGYDKHGERLPCFTRIGSAFSCESLQQSSEPWKLPASWHSAREQLDMNLPFNFLCTADIGNGSAGSPIVNKNLELVGLVFDGNIHSLASDLLYTGKNERATCVHAAAIRHALRQIYGAGDLADQLGR